MNQNQTLALEPLIQFLLLVLVWHLRKWAFRAILELYFLSQS